MPRRRPRWLLSGVIILVVAAVSGVSVWLVTTTEDSPPAAPAPTSTVEDERAPETPLAPLSTPAPVPAVPPGALVEAAERAAAPGMTLGVAVLDLGTGELVAGREGRREFASASLSKLILVVDMVDRRRAEGRPIAEPDLALVGRALSSSDDGAMNVLWGRYDGPGAVRRVATRLGLSATAPADSSQWGDTDVTAADLAVICGYIVRDMPAEDRAVIVDALAAAQPTAPDGFAQYYGLLRQGASQRVFAKQAWVPWRPAGYLLHSAGIAYDPRTSNGYAIALLSIVPNAGAQAARDRLSTVAAAALGAIGVP